MINDKSILINYWLRTLSYFCLAEEAMLTFKTVNNCMVRNIPLLSKSDKYN